MPADCLHDHLETRRLDAGSADFDRWLRRVVLARLAPLTDGSLPPAIAGLAAELELKLRQARHQ